jgi:anti-anti-sigma factor
VFAQTKSYAPTTAITPGAFKPDSLATSVESNFDVEVVNGTQAVVIGVRGELDLASSPALEQELERGAAATAEVVIVDLRNLEFMDSTGLSVLVRAHQRATENGQRFGVVRGPQQVQRLLSLTGVADRLNLADSPDELLTQS